MPNKEKIKEKVQDLRVRKDLRVRVNAIEAENFQQTWSEDDWTSWKPSWEDCDEDWTVNAVYDGSWDFQDYSYDE